MLEHLRGVFTTRYYTNLHLRHLYLALLLCIRWWTHPVEHCRNLPHGVFVIRCSQLSRQHWADREAGLPADVTGHSASASTDDRHHWVSIWSG